MSWTYVLPITTPKDEVRFLSGDTDSTRQLVQDEEISWVLTKYPDTTEAAAVVCESIAAKLGQNTDATVGDVSESASQAAEAFRKRAEELRKQAGVLAAPVFGGVYRAQHDALDQDTSITQPSFKVGQDDHPGVPNERMTTQEEW